MFFELYIDVEDEEDENAKLLASIDSADYEYKLEDFQVSKTHAGYKCSYFAMFDTEFQVNNSIVQSSLGLVGLLK